MQLKTLRDCLLHSWRVRPDLEIHPGAKAVARGYAYETGMNVARELRNEGLIERVPGKSAIYRLTPEGRERLAK